MTSHRSSDSSWSAVLIIWRIFLLSDTCWGLKWVGYVVVALLDERVYRIATLNLDSEVRVLQGLAQEVNQVVLD
jgi:hypothetical protein